MANNTAALTGVDYLAFHQARVAVLSMSIGASVGYDRPRRVQLGMAGGLIDVGLWQVPEALLRRLDALSADEQTIYRSHPRLSVELIRRWSPRAKASSRPCSSTTSASRDRASRRACTAPP